MTAWAWRPTSALFLSLFGLALAHCSSVDSVPAKSVAENPYANDGPLMCRATWTSDGPDTRRDISGLNQFLYLNAELREASGLSKVTNCDEAEIFVHSHIQYLLAHPGFSEIMKERFAAAGWSNPFHPVDEPSNGRMHPEEKP